VSFNKTLGEMSAIWSKYLFFLFQLSFFLVICLQDNKGSNSPFLLICSMNVPVPFIFKICRISYLYNTEYHTLTYAS